MSFSGRLSNSSTNVNANDSVVPLSMSSTSSWDLLWHQQDHPESKQPTTLVKHDAPVRRSRVTSGLAEELVKCRAALTERDKTIADMKQDRDAMLTAICRQLLELECGLRKKEKELTSSILQKEKVIREQAYLIRMLSKKTGAKRSDIRQLCNEAKAKIPQVRVVVGGDTAKPLDGPHAFGSIENESRSENDSDSAIVLDDERLRHSSPEMSTTLPRKIKRQKPVISRSVSTIALGTSSQDFDAHLASYNDSSTPVSSPHLSDGLYDDDPSFSGFDTAHYRGFLLRHGSYERYKSKMIKTNDLENQVNGVCTLPRRKTNSKTGVHLHIGDDLRRRVEISNMTDPADVSKVSGCTREAMANLLSKSETDLRISSRTNSYKSVIRCDAPSSASTITDICSSQTKTCGKSSSTVVMINTDQESFQPGLLRAQTNHRRITKPRDVKNRSKTTKLNMASRTKSRQECPTPNYTNEDGKEDLQHFVKKSGSVYCSIFLSSDDSYSFA